LKEGCSCTESLATRGGGLLPFSRWDTCGGYHCRYEVPGDDGAHGDLSSLQQVDAVVSCHKAQPSRRARHRCCRHKDSPAVRGTPESSGHSHRDNPGVTGTLQPLRIIQPLPGSPGSYRGPPFRVITEILQPSQRSSRSSLAAVTGILQPLQGFFSRYRKPPAAYWWCGTSSSAHLDWHHTKSMITRSALHEPDDHRILDDRAR
jgi:hypothetical protein